MMILEDTVLPIAKKPSYLSPSSLWQLENNPNKFYMERMNPNPIPREPQGTSAGVGSAFDYFIKMSLAKELNILDTVKKRLLDGLFDKEEMDYYKEKTINEIAWLLSVEPHNRKEAAESGRLLFNIYNESARKNVKFVDVEININKVIEGVPIMGKLDAVAEINDSDTGASDINADGINVTVPHDWKTSGYGSESGTSPKPGYYAIWEGGRDKGPHKKYVKGIPFEQIDSDWATQLCTYGWLMDKPIGKDFEALLDMVVIRPTSIRVAQYRGTITKDFQMTVLDRYKKAWLSLVDNSFVKSLGDDLIWVDHEAQNEGWF